MKVLILGADGFIGRHIAFALRQAGHEVLASARRVRALDQMGFRTLAADLTNPATHDPGFWRPHLAGGVALVNAAGILTGTGAAFQAIHVAAPRAAYAALDGGAALLISAVGIDRAPTAFAEWRRAGEAAARSVPGMTILRPGLVLADTAYGGSALMRALAAFPLRTPVIGTGDQPVNPVHATDLARLVELCLTAPPGVGPWPVGGPEVTTEAGMIRRYRRWLGLPDQPLLRVPDTLALWLGGIGDRLRLGPVSQTSVRQLQAGLLADGAALTAATGFAPRPFGALLTDRPAGTGDLWQARLYLLKPAIRMTLAVLWLASGLIGLFLPSGHFLPLFAGAPLGQGALALLARAGGVADLALGLALVRNWRPRAVGLAQMALVLGYTAGLTLLAPGEWLAPLGGLLKNLPVLALIATHLALAEER